MKIYNVYSIYYNVRVPLISEVVSLSQSGRGEGLSPKSCLMDWKQCLLEEILCQCHWTKACDPLLLLSGDPHWGHRELVVLYSRGGLPFI